MPSSAITVNDFPDICEAIYEEKESVANLSMRYSAKLRETGLLPNILYANKLDEANAMLRHPNLKELERDFYYFKEHLRKKYKKHSIPFTIKYRQKDFVRYNNKIRSYLINEDSLDRIQDFLGMRIILTSPAKDTLETVKQCYQILGDVIDFFIVEKHGLLLKGKAEVDKNFDVLKHSDLVIPKEDWVLPHLKNNVKNYIMYPKGKGGYQSLHLSIKMTNGSIVEFQIRTFAMDVWAEEGDASHIKYSQNRRAKSDIYLDYTKIQIPGFAFLSSKKICDTSGLIKSINPFNFF